MVTRDPVFGNVGGLGISGDFGDIGGGGAGGKFSRFGGDVNLMILLALQIEERLGIRSQLRDVLEAQDVTITPGAYLMMLIPLYEVSQQQGAEGLRFGVSGLGGDLLSADQQKTSEAVTSFTKLIDQAKSDPADFDTELAESHPPESGVAQRIVTSLSIIKAYWKKFCDIPPFCRKTK